MVLRVSQMCNRDVWRERTWREALAGIKPSPEPNWGLRADQPSESQGPRISRRRSAEYDAMVSDYNATTPRFTPEGIPIPGRL